MIWFVPFRSGFPDKIVNCVVVRFHGSNSNTLINFEFQSLPKLCRETSVALTRIKKLPTNLPKRKPKNKIEMDTCINCLKPINIIPA